MFDIEAPDWLADPVYSSMLSDSERLRELADRAPAARPTADLAQLDLAALSAGDRLELLAVLDQQRSWLESIQLRLLADLGRRDRTALGLSQEQASAVLRVPLRTAQRQLATARTVTHRLPRTLRAMAAGQLTGRHAQTIAEAAERLPDELAADLEARVIDRAANQSVPQLKQAVRRAVIALDPAGAEDRQQQAVADRAVRLDPAEDGLCNLSALLRAEDGQLIFARLTAAAQSLPAADPRGIDQQRADLFVDALLAALSPNELPTVRGRKPTIGVIVSADTLLQLDDQPGHLEGYGPITAETARRIAADSSATWRRLLTDPDTGQLLDLSADTYRPSQRLRDYVTARDGSCVFPTCNQPGYRCEYEHITPYLQGGRTCRCNGALACRRHNRCKVNTGWDYQANPDGSFTWIDDTGREYRSHPPDRWPRPGDRLPAQPPPPAADMSQLHADEDAAYQRLAAASQRELDAAQQAGDADWIGRARQAIAAEQRQRARQLAHRADPNEAPF